MIDIETLDTSPSAVILSVGLVGFTKDRILEEQYTVLPIQQQINDGRTISESTLKWWMNQSKEARAVFDTKPTEDSLKLSLVQLSNFISRYNKAKIWSYGANFDTVLIDDLMRTSDVKIPWNYWDIRCLRTFCDDHHAPLPKDAGVLHNALDDARRQAQHMINVWSKK